ncbi:histone-lysine N-methyltransferase ATX2-like protein isoform X1 [Tanacetum coccineum]
MNLITEYIDLALLVRLGNESYFGRIAKYDSESHRHYVEYEDGDEELVTLSKERIKFHVSLEEMKCLRLTCDLHCSETDDLDVNKMIVLTANLDDCHDIELGDIIWAKLTGHAVWPAIVWDESFLSIRRGLSKISGEKSVLTVGTDLEGDGKMDEGSGDSKKTCLSTELVETKFKGTKSGPFDSRGFGSIKACHLFRLLDVKLFHAAEAASESFFKSGADMFGFSDPHVLRLIQEYANNLFLQCDKCRMMVHARCYGELELVDRVLWLCNLCRPGAPEVSPPCCLCPVTGGAMKPTTDGRWAHLACAMWIPETCLSDIKKMEPVDGLNRISKVITSIRLHFTPPYYCLDSVLVQTMLVMWHIILFALVLLFGFLESLLSGLA